MRNEKGQFVKGKGFWTGKKRPGFKGTFKKGSSPWNKGKKMSDSTKEKIRLAHKGKPKLSMRGYKNPQWKGGKVKLKIRLIGSYIYKFWREQIFKRDNFTCVMCKQKGGNLEADHIIPYSYLIKKYQIKTVDEAINCKELWDVSNGRTLCKMCHKKTDTYSFKALYYEPK